MDLIYCVEDDEGIRDLITYAVKSAGFEAEGFESASDFEKRLGERLPSMVLLDIMLPDKDGIAILKDIRNNDTTKNVPVIMITAKGTESDKVKGFEYGADDYVTKPFNPLELVARVKSQLRRFNELGGTAQEPKETIYKVGGLQINDDLKQVTVDGEFVKLTPIEYNILLLLMKNQGKVFSINQIYESIWNEEAIGADNTVAVHIRHIREKIEINPKDPRYLKVVWGVGYKIEKA